MGNVRRVVSALALCVAACGGEPPKAGQVFKNPALARSLHGRSRVARTLMAWVRAGERIAGSAIRPVDVNGAPGALLLDGEGRLISVWALDIAGGQIQGVASVVNPEKLAHLGPVADVRALLERRER